MESAERNRLTARIKQIQADLKKLDVRAEYFDFWKFSDSELAEILESIERQFEQRKKFLGVKNKLMTENEPTENDAICPDCGEIADWQDCEFCEGEGIFPLDKVCPVCKGVGGRFVCSIGCESAANFQTEDTRTAGDI